MGHFCHLVPGQDGISTQMPGYSSAREVLPSEVVQ